jgi:hypothetical protein
MRKLSSLNPENYKGHNMLSKIDALRAYATMMNTLNAEDFLPLLADDCHYESQWVFAEIKSKREFLAYITGKLQTLKTSGKRVWAELGHCYWGPCVVLAEDERENLVATLVVEIENEKIKRMDLCGAPSPYLATRTGEYPRCSNIKEP